MGNLCLKATHKKAYVFDTKGRLQKIKLPITVGKLMHTEGHPEGALCRVDHLRRLRAIAGLGKDTNLEAGMYYVLFPAESLLDRRLSASDIQRIEEACKSKGNKIGLVTETKSIFDLALEGFLTPDDL